MCEREREGGGERKSGVCFSNSIYKDCSLGVKILSNK